MTTAKTIGVFFVIFGCFAILYPKIFHPMVVQVFGLGSTNARTQRPQDIHPRDRMPRPSAPSAGQGSPANDAMRSHMRAGMHPGMRAAAEMKKQAAEQGGNRGMMGMILPMYAVGIILYLVYTMTKVFMKNKDSGDGKNNDGHDPYTRYRPEDYPGSYDKQARFQADLANDADFLLSKKEKLVELEQLLAKAEGKKINDTEMRLLKDRLQETEAQMSRILTAMEHVQTRVKDGIDAKIKETDAQRAAEDENVTLNKEEGPRRRVQPSCDSSPDMDSYEIIDKGKGNVTDSAKMKSKGKLEASNPMNTDLNALDSESSGRESDDENEDSESVDVDDGAPNMMAAAGCIGAGLGIGAAMSMPVESDPMDVLGLDAREVEVVGSLGRAFNVSEGDDDDDDGSDDGDDDDDNEIDYDDDDDVYADEPPVETIDGDGEGSADEKPEGLRKRLPVDKTDSS
ncbi:resistance to inhibitors of cholinesterase protein 3-like [Lineus longissimus]|uniref:resistance to inhibitors of cholinesterase protein 3-like n=1 Tax=Lineus longissimus TaxID=88925 RepID=UPI00315C7B58